MSFGVDKEPGSLLRSALRRINSEDAEIASGPSIDVIAMMDGAAVAEATRVTKDRAAADERLCLAMVSVAATEAQCGRATPSVAGAAAVRAIQAILDALHGNRDPQVLSVSTAGALGPQSRIDVDAIERAVQT